MNLKTIGMVCLLLVLGISTVAIAQQQDGLVNVNLSKINAEIAKNINVDVSNIPVTVQAPIGVAANVCNIAANVLARQAQSGEASCDAQQTSTALNSLVQQRLGGAGQGGQQGGGGQQPQQPPQ